MMAGRGAAPAGRSRKTGTRAASGLPPGTTKSPCQELAEGSVGAAMRDGPD